MKKKMKTIIFSSLILLVSFFILFSLSAGENQIWDQSGCVCVCVCGKRNRRDTFSRYSLFANHLYWNKLHNMTQLRSKSIETLTGKSYWAFTQIIQSLRRIIPLIRHVYLGFQSKESERERNKEDFPMNMLCTCVVWDDALRRVRI